MCFTFDLDWVTDQPLAVSHVDVAQCSEIEFC